MIKNIEYVANQRTLIKVKTDKGNFCIGYKAIRPYWDYASSDDFEGGLAIISGDYLIFTMQTAGGQGGVFAFGIVTRINLSISPKVHMS